MFIKKFPTARPAFQAAVASALVLIFKSGCSEGDKEARRLDRADNYLADGKYEQARIEYKNLLRDDPQNIRANFGMGSIWLLQGSPVRAIQFLATADILSPGDPEI